MSSLVASQYEILDLTYELINNFVELLENPFTSMAIPRQGYNINLLQGNHPHPVLIMIHIHTMHHQHLLE